MGVCGARGIPGIRGSSMCSFCLLIFGVLLLCCSHTAGVQSTPACPGTQVLFVVGVGWVGTQVVFARWCVQVLPGMGTQVLLLHTCVPSPPCVPTPGHARGVVPLLLLLLSFFEPGPLS